MKTQKQDYRRNKVSRWKRILISGIFPTSIVGTSLFLANRAKNEIDAIEPVIENLIGGDHFVSGSPWDCYDSSTTLVLEYLSEFKNNEGNYSSINLLRDSIKKYGYNIQRLELEIEMMIESPLPKEELARYMAIGKWDERGRFEGIRDLVLHYVDRNK